MLLMTLMEKKLWKHFTKTNCKKQKEFRIEKVMKRKGEKLYVTWKGYDTSFISWIDKKRQYKSVNIFQNQNLQEHG